MSAVSDHPHARERRRLFRQIGSFLDAHDLCPSPANYALVHQLFAKKDSSLARAVREATADGIRLSQRDADTLLAEYGLKNAGRAAAAPAPAEDAASEAVWAAQRQVEDFSALVGVVQAATREYTRDLAAQEAELNAGGGGLDVAEILRITGAIIRRSEAAERQLDVARADAATLREKLARVEDQARRDPLTGLANRRAFEDRSAEIRASGTRSSLAICDIDHFKTINDRYGHIVGDRVLRLIARTLGESCAGHFLARVGGEEFVLLFEGLAPDAAAAILDEARLGLAARRFRLLDNDEPIGAITFSAGIAPIGVGEGDCDALQRADAFLYEAKQRGRNQIRFTVA